MVDIIMTAIKSFKCDGKTIKIEIHQSSFCCSVSGKNVVKTGFCSPLTATAARKTAEKLCKDKTVAKSIRAFIWP